jgi:hypothetical protein
MKIESPALPGFFLGLTVVESTTCRTGTCVTRLQYGSTNCAQVLQRKFKPVLTLFLAESGVV